MKYTLVMFTSRSDTMRFYSLIKTYGFASIINTPRSLSRSCGISVKIGGNLVGISQNIIRNNNFASFKGIYELSTTNSLPNRII